MRIAYLSTFYPYRGGIAQFNAALFDELSKTNQTKAYNFITQYPNFLFPGTSQMVQKNDIVEIVDAEKVLSTINPITYLTAAKKINSFSPDLILTKFWMPFFAPSLGTTFKYLNKKTKKVAILDNVIPHEKRIGDMSLIRYFIKNTDHFIVMSNTVKNDLLKIDPKAKYTEVVHPLYNHFGEKKDKTIAREILNLPQDKKVILFFGFIRDYKGLDNLIESMTLLDKNFVLLVCGEVYGSFDKYSKLIDDNNLKDRVYLFNKYISDLEVVDYFSASDVCVLPYKTATQSGIVGISYNFDLPVIATNTGGLKEMIQPYNTGIIIEKSDKKTIADGITQYFNSNKNELIKNISKYKEIASWRELANKIELIK